MTLYDSAKDAIARRIYISRVSTGKTQSEFAKSLGLTPQRWRNYEVGYRFPPPDVVLAMWREYQITADYIFLGRTETLSYPVGLAIDAARERVENSIKKAET